jgi:hypothetical protein
LSDSPFVTAVRFDDVIGRLEHAERLGFHQLLTPTKHFVRAVCTKTRTQKLLRNTR